ncbi:hypothetical protein ACJ8MF_03245 [Bifidobacterium adolescentis]|uniref:hypothetical protein n=1 Tax=Bifidobacterium adolescentis TaxID=1680 RepID=UPI003B99E065
MWFIIDDQMADDRRIRRLPLATVGLWVKLCVIHSKGISMQAKDPAAYPGYFDKLDLKDAGGTMKQLQQLIDMGLMEERGGGWRPVYAEGICKEPKTLTEEQREARRKAGSKGGRRKAANQKAKQPSSNLLANGQANGQANGEQNSGETGSETSSKLLEDSQAKTWHKTDTDTDIPSPTPPAGTAKQTASEAPDAFAAIAETYPGTIGAKGRKAEREARDLVETITENPVQLARLQSAVRRYRRAVNDGHVPQRQVPRLATWLRDQWETWAPEPITPTRQHKHTWNCEHVHQLMDPHEDEYDHSGSLREGNPSKWYLACQACADELNQETSKEKQ